MTRLTDAFRILAQYNRVANERLLTTCAGLDSVEYRRQRSGSFGSIHALLNHVLVGDGIWMARFAGGGSVTPALDTILFEEFQELREARVHQDAAIESFFATVDDAFLEGTIPYMNSQGRKYIESVPVAVLHFFNHQTHHRGQVHVMLSQTALKTPSLDMHRIINP